RRAWACSRRPIWKHSSPPAPTSDPPTATLNRLVCRHSRLAQCRSGYSPMAAGWPRSSATNRALAGTTNRNRRKEPPHDANHSRLRLARSTVPPPALQPCVGRRTAAHLAGVPDAGVLLDAVRSAAGADGAVGG